MKKITLLLFSTLSLQSFSQAVPDPTFNAVIEEGASVLVIRQLPDGKLLVGGNNYQINDVFIYAIRRLNPDGSNDASFHYETMGRVNDILVEDDGKFLIAGDNGLKKFNGDGSEDATFTSAIIIGGFNSLFGVVKQDDKYIVAGTFFAAHSNGTVYRNLARLNSDGSLDGTFASTEGFSGSTYVKVQVQQDSRLFVWGGFSYTGSTQERNNIMRLNADGSVDETFTGTGSNNVIDDAAIQPDGKYIATGRFSLFNDISNRCAVRLNTDGSIDDSFSYTPGPGLPEDGVIGYDIVVQPDGKILVGGMFADAMQDIEGTPDGSIPMNLVRLNSDGSTDTAFSAHVNNYIYALCVQEDGKLLVGGFYTTFNDTPVNNLVRLDYNALSVTDETQASLSVYPNPVSNTLFIDTSSLNAVVAYMTLFDVSGKVMHGAEGAAGMAQVDMSGYQDGIYFLKLATGNGTVVKKIIKN